MKWGNLCLRIPPEAPFYWKLLRIGIQSAKDMRKDGLNFQVLYHTQVSGQTLLGRSVFFSMA